MYVKHRAVSQNYVSLAERLVDLLSIPHKARCTQNGLIIIIVLLKMHSIIIELIVN